MPVDGVGQEGSIVLDVEAPVVGELEQSVRVQHHLAQALGQEPVPEVHPDGRAPDRFLHQASRFDALVTASGRMKPCRVQAAPMAVAMVIQATQAIM